MLIDQSTSMGHRLASGQTKSAFLADVLNKTIYTLITNCSKADGVRDYFDVGVIAYSGDGARNGFDGQLGDRFLHAVSRLAELPLRIETRIKTVHGEEDHLLKQEVKFPVWFDPKNRGKTSMCAGLSMALDVVREWCVYHPTAFPPTVLHVTDGHPTDGNPERIADKLKAIGTEDGACLMFNLHVDVGNGRSLLFPHQEGAMKDRFGRALFRMSSVLPPPQLAAAKSKGYAVQPGARGFVFNAGIEAIADFFDIGTRPALISASASDRLPSKETSVRHGLSGRNQ
jgi:hypothetical protein